MGGRDVIAKAQSRSPLAALVFCAALCTAFVPATFAQDQTTERAPDLVPTAPEQTTTTTQSQAQQRVVLPFLVFDAERVQEESDAYRALSEKIDVIGRALSLENDQIYQELESEELALTELKPKLSEAAFQLKAMAFDEKVTALRAAQADKAKAVQAQFDQGLQELQSQMNAEIDFIVRQTGALLVFEKRQTYRHASGIDITNALILRLNAWSAAQAAENVQGNTQPQETDPSATDNGAQEQ